ncbi:MAG: hypothetical protein ABI389_02745 [Rhodanobacter sp.]
MKTVSIVVAFALLGVAAAALCAPPSPTEDRLVKTMALQAFFHAPHPWQLAIYEPRGDDFLVGRPVRACFTGPQLNHPGAGTHCSELYENGSVQGVPRYPCQRFQSAKLEMLPGPSGTPPRPSLVVRARYVSGTNGELRCTFVWNFDNPSTRKKTFPNNPGYFIRMFQSDTNQTGQQEFMKRGPLAGAFIRVGQVWQPGPAESSLESPMRFEIDVYEPAKFGYLKVLSFLSKDRYASNNSDRGTPDPISVLTPEIERALKAVYPDGKSSVLGQ